MALAEVLIFCGAFMALLLGLGQLVLRHKRAKNYLLGALLLATAGWQFHTALYFWQPKVDFSFHAFWNLPLLFLTGPLLYYYFRQLIGYEIHLRKRAFLHALPAVLTCIFLAPFYTKGGDCKTEMLTGIAGQCAGITAGEIFALSLAALLSITVYLLMTLFLAARLLRQNRALVKSSDWVSLIFIAGNIANTILCAWGILTGMSELVKASAVIVTCILCILFLVGLRYERFLNVTRIEAEKIRYEKSRLGDLDLKDTLHKLNALMREKRLFENESLTLVALAAEMAMSVQQLSEAINKGLGKNFYQFINEYRVAAACELLAEEREKNILDIAFSVGFNSKSVFNRVFTQLKGLTPSEYRRKKTPAHR